LFAHSPVPNRCSAFSTVRPKLAIYPNAPQHNSPSITASTIRVQKTRVFLKSPTQWVFWVLMFFLDKQEKIGKIIQKLSNLKP